MTTLQEIKEWFENWTKIKIQVQINERILFFREKEIWWASLGANIGFEQNGKNNMYERPVLVLRKFSKDMFWAIPLTTKDREGSFYFSLQDFRSTAILVQLKLMSSKRLIRRLGIIDPVIFIQIKEKLAKLL